MATNGKIYILRNPYLKDAVVKIGKTVRSSEARSKEISAATGVPHEFEVLYEEDVEDCDLAETIIHERLDSFRVNPKREFFSLPLKEAVRTVFRVCLELNKRLHGNLETRIVVSVRDSVDSSTFVDKFKSIIEKYKGGDVGIYLLYKSNKVEALILLGAEWKISVRPGFLKKLKAIEGVEQMEFLTEDPNADVEGIAF